MVPHPCLDSTIARSTSARRRRPVESILFGLAMALVACGPTGNDAVPEIPPSSEEATSVDQRIGVRSSADLRASLAARLRAEIPSQENPWVLSHALLAFGPDLRFGAGEQSAIDRLAERWVQRQSGRAFVPLQGAGTLGEQHPHLVLKTLLQVASDHSVGGPLADDLAQTAIAEFSGPTTFEEKNDLAWLLEAIARLGLEPETPIRPGAPTPRALARTALETVEAGDGIVEAALSAAEFVRPGGSGEPTTDGLYAYTCGGQHLLQALVTAAEFGLLEESDRQRLERRLDVYLDRVDAEYEFRRREYSKAVAAGHPEILSEQMFAMFTLKLLGHGLEILGRAQRIGLGDRAKIQAAVSSMRGKLLGIIRRLDEDLDPDRTLLPRLRRSRPLLWQLWFGDSCHALRGLIETDAGDR